MKKSKSKPHMSTKVAAHTLLADSGGTRRTTAAYVPADAADGERS